MWSISCENGSTFFEDVHCAEDVFASFVAILARVGTSFFVRECGPDISVSPHAQKGRNSMGKLL